jgi:predicted transcriptional regulator
MAIQITLKPDIARYIDDRVKAGEAPSSEAFLNALVEERIAREADYERWFRGKVLQGIAAADAGHFASDEELDAVATRWS